MADPAEQRSGLFRCTRCGAAPNKASPTHLACATCGHVISAADGIIDFVGGTATTDLDNIDYDQRYGINEAHSLDLYHLLLRATGPLWPKRFGTALEIGCGTGGLSLALLRNITADHVVLTDISPKMLRLCRNRLDTAAIANPSALTFATYSGTEACFQPNAFDTCFGTAVVHHITDVRDFLANIHTLLKPGGCAFFMEPNLAFHQALTRTMADIIADALQTQSLSDADISLMLNWTGEVHCNIANTGDIELLAEREDKHLFVGETFAGWARAAGFSPAAALPCDPDPTGWNTIQTYLDQSGVSQQGFATLKPLWAAKHGGHFADLRNADQSPSYLFWLRKPLRPPAVTPDRPAPAPSAQPPRAAARTNLQLRLQPDGEALQLAISGWCVSNPPVRSIQIRTCGSIRRVPVWRPRPDVHLAINCDGTYPPLHALCSGIDDTIRLHPGHPDPIDITVEIVPVDSPPEPLRFLTLAVGQSIDIIAP